LFQRAAQAYLWALPLINALGMKDGSEKVFGAHVPNEVVKTQWAPPPLTRVR
jgi:hypothetical protein